MAETRESHGWGYQPDESSPDDWEGTREITDLTLRCVDCGSDFVWEAGERAFFLGKGLAQPKRCPTCRAKRKATINRDNGRRE